MYEKVLAEKGNGGKKLIIVIKRSELGVISLEEIIVRMYDLKFFVWTCFHNEYMHPVL